MNCHESTYSGFSSAEARRYKTVPRPSSDIPVRQLRRAYADNSCAATAEALEAEGVEQETPNLDWLGCLIALVSIVYILFFY